MRLKHLCLVFLLPIVLAPYTTFCYSSQTLPVSGDNLSEEDKEQGTYYELALQNLMDHYEDERAIHVRNSKRTRQVSYQSQAFAPLSSPRRIVSVDDFLGKRKVADHTKAFRKAWHKACTSKNGVFLVPKNKVYRVKPINFTGPCHSDFSIKISGTIQASDNMADYRDRRHWLVFENIRNFKVQGGGTIDGKGEIWWQNSCKINKSKPCQHAPTAVTFLGCKNFKVDGIRTINAQQMHIVFQKCENVRASNLVVHARGDSPNTDGIHVTETRNIRITSSHIKTGDDCISIVSGSKNVEVIDLNCGPGHGISIGSLGKGLVKAHVSNVLVNRARLSGTTNGVRIKTWQGGRGYAKNIVFENIAMDNVSHPIIIDQHYCDQETPCPERKAAVRIRNVVYRNIKGTSATDVAIKLDCSSRHRCGAIGLENINIITEGKQQAKADCRNAQAIYRETVSPKCSHVT